MSIQNKKKQKNFRNFIEIREDKNHQGLIKYIGEVNEAEEGEDPEIIHYIYLRTQNDFNYQNNSLCYKWTVKVLCSPKFLGIGLADKNAVMKNNARFFSNDQDFYNGVYCLYSLYNEELGINQIRPWHPGDPDLNSQMPNFPDLKNGIEIILQYHNKDNKLEFIPPKKKKHILCIMLFLEEN